MSVPNNIGSAITTPIMGSPMSTANIGMNPATYSQPSQRRYNFEGGFNMGYGPMRSTVTLPKGIATK